MPKSRGKVQKVKNRSKAARKINYSPMTRVRRTDDGDGESPRFLQNFREERMNYSHDDRASNPLCLALLAIDSSQLPPPPLPSFLSFNLTLFCSISDRHVKVRKGAQIESHHRRVQPTASRRTAVPSKSREHAPKCPLRKSGRDTIKRTGVFPYRIPSNPTALPYTRVANVNFSISFHSS